MAQRAHRSIPHLVMATQPPVHFGTQSSLHHFPSSVYVLHAGNVNGGIRKDLGGYLQSILGHVRTVEQGRLSAVFALR